MTYATKEKGSQNNFFPLFFGLKIIPSSKNINPFWLNTKLRNLTNIYNHHEVWLRSSTFCQLQSKMSSYEVGDLLWVHGSNDTNILSWIY